MKAVTALCVAVTAGLAVGCGRAATVPPLPVHEHRAPHGGTLVEVGEEFAHVELALRSEHFTAYVLDGEAEDPVRIAQRTLVLHIRKPHLDVVLTGVANTLTGETVGDTSQFSGGSPSLKAVSAFDGVIDTLNVRGVHFGSLPFHYVRGFR